MEYPKSGGGDKAWVARNVDKTVEKVSFKFKATQFFVLVLWIKRQTEKTVCVVWAFLFTEGKVRRRLSGVDVMKVPENAAV